MKKRLKFFRRNLVQRLSGFLQQVQLGVGPGSLDGVADHQNDPDVRPQLGDFFDLLLDMAA
jgi:hypothetical protein